MWDRLVACTVVPAVLAGCTATGPQTPVTPAAARSSTKHGNEQLQFKLASGVYRCELGQSVEVQRNNRKDGTIELVWQGSRHSLQRHDSSSGLPRYEDQQNGLLWIDLPWKSVLVDARSGRPLANECKAAQGKAMQG